MAKIKTINNATLRQYLEAYTALFAVEPSNKEYKEKINAIKKALELREATGYDVQEKNLTQKLTGMFKFMKKKK